MRHDLNGKVAIVTGAARGLGRGYALRLAELGADVVVADIDLAGASVFGEALTAGSVMEEVEALGRKSLGVSGDLSRVADVERLFDATLAVFGHVDILVNNAGGAIARESGPLPSETSAADFDRLLDANLKSTVLCAQAAARIMRGQGGGVIVNVASQAGISTLPLGMLGMYGALKAAVIQFTRALAAELGPQGIRVNALAPGIIMTSRVAAQARVRDIGTEAQERAIPLGRFGEVADCASALEFLATDLSSYVTGQCLSVCGGAVLAPN